MEEQQVLVAKAASQALPAKRAQAVKLQVKMEQFLIWDKK